MRLVSPTGSTKNSPIANASEITIVTPHAAPESCSCSSSGSCALADSVSARSPIASDSASAITPRMTGSRYARRRRSHETSGNEWTSVAPSGLRTATDHVETPRIMTPSRTAWPPIGASREAVSEPPSPIERLSAGAGRTPTLGGAALEALYATAGVNELLSARIERMTRRADLDVDLGLR